MINKWDYFKNPDSLNNNRDQSHYFPNLQEGNRHHPQIQLSGSQVRDSKKSRAQP